VIRGEFAVSRIYKRYNCILHNLEK